MDKGRRRLTEYKEGVGERLKTQRGRLEVRLHRTTTEITRHGSMEQDMAVHTFNADPVSKTQNKTNQTKCH